jgi:hypothetical protein
MALCPEGVDLTRLTDKTWYTRSARQSSAKLGAQDRDLILARLQEMVGATEQPATGRAVGIAAASQNEVD